MEVIRIDVAQLECVFGAILFVDNGRIHAEAELSRAGPHCIE